jgi:uncharacterized membrane protein YsdA (DUF1294 family)
MLAHWEGITVMFWLFFFVFDKHAAIRFSSRSSERKRLQPTILG